MQSETLNCRCCGGALNNSSKLCVCQHCGATNFISDVANKNVIKLNRANKLRQENDFDNAARIYDAILEENAPTSDILWYRTLCEYGIEYVADPVTYKYFPTLHRISDESIKDNSFFLQSLELSEDEQQKETLIKEADYINEIQIKYLNIASNEKPYDVFICYKETDMESGEYTEDAQLAEELFKELTGSGFKVFFARETLKNKLSIDYEPYIFAALKSAKAMAVIGTKSEYFSSVWVKNEWGRFLKLSEKNPEKKMFFACYDPEELPRAFASKQAQLLGKEGAIKNLAANIERFLKESNSHTVHIDVADTYDISEEQERFDRILFTNSEKFVKNIEITEVGKRKKDIIEEIENHKKVMQKTYQKYNLFFYLGGMWTVLAYSFLMFNFAILTSNLRYFHFFAYPIVTSLMILMDIGIGLMLVPLNRFIIIPIAFVLIPMEFVFPYFVDTYFYTSVFTLAIPILLIFIGFFTKKTNRYYQSNIEEYRAACTQIEVLRNLKDYCKKEYLEFATKELIAYKKTYKTSEKIQINDYQYDAVKEQVGNYINAQINRYSTFNHKLDTAANSRVRIIFSIIMVVIAFVVGILYTAYFLRDSVFAWILGGVWNQLFN